MLYPYLAFPAHSRRSAIPSFGTLILGITVAIFSTPSVHAQLHTNSQTLFGDARTGEWFGMHVAVSGDTLVASTDGNKRIYVFVRTSSGWSLQQQIAANYSNYSDGPVAIDGDTLVAASEIYVRSGGVWTLQQSLPFNDPRPALQGDTLALGVPLTPDGHTNNDGSVYIFTRSGTTWTQQAQLHTDIPGMQEQMGTSVKLDGNTLVATPTTGGTGSGGAYVFTGSGSTWTREARLPLPSGNNWMGVALQGNTIAQSDPASNVIYLYDRTGTTWNRTATITLPATGHDAFGDRLGLSGTLLGATADGLFYLYSHTGAGWVLAQSFGGGGIASDLALANLGKTFVLTNPFDNTQGYSNGIVKVFDTPPPPAPGGGWHDDDVGAVGIAGGSADNNGTVTVSGSGADIWDRADQFHFRSQTLTGDGAIVARVTSAGSGNPWSKIGLMFREDLAPAARTAMVLLTPGGHLGTQFRADTFDTTSFLDVGWDVPPQWMMLTRAGDTFAGYRSDDGASWTPIGSATIVMPATVYVGLAVSSHDNTALNTGVFDGVDLVPLDTVNAPVNLSGTVVNGFDLRLQWADNACEATDFTIERATGDASGAFNPVATVAANVTTYTDTGLNPDTTYSYRVRALRGSVTSPPSAPFTLTMPPASSGELRGTDIGAVNVFGSFSTADGVTTINAAGADIWDQEDSCYFLYHVISGDFDVRACITGLGDTDPWAKAGVMIRATLDPSSPNVFAMIAAGGVVGLQSRVTAGASTNLTEGPWVDAPYWTRLVRSGSTFTAYCSPDGSNWTLVGTQVVNMGATVSAGVAVTSHNPSTATQATITSLTFTPN